MTIHLFKTINGISVVGKIKADYVDSYQILDPILLEEEDGILKAVPCNIVHFSNDKYSINLDKFKVLYVLNQDFIAPEVIKLYQDFFKQSTQKEISSTP